MIFFPSKKVIDIICFSDIKRAFKRNFMQRHSFRGVLPNSRSETFYNIYRKTLEIEFFLIQSFLITSIGL